MVTTVLYYPTDKRQALRMWEWHLVVYWNMVIRDFPQVPLAHYRELAETPEKGETLRWEYPAPSDSRSWRWRFLKAKLGLGRAIQVEALPMWLQAVVSVRFLDEPLPFFGRPMASYPARFTKFRLA